MLVLARNCWLLLRLLRKLMLLLGQLLLLGKLEEVSRSRVVEHRVGTGGSHRVAKCASKVAEHAHCIVLKLALLVLLLVLAVVELMLQGSSSQADCRVNLVHAVELLLMLLLLEHAVDLRLQGVLVSHLLRLLLLKEVEGAGVLRVGSRELLGRLLVRLSHA